MDEQLTKDESPDLHLRGWQVKATKSDGTTFIAYNGWVFKTRAEAEADATERQMYPDVRYEVVAVQFFPITSVLDRGRA